MKRVLRLVIAGLLIMLGSVLGLQTGLSPYQCSSSLNSAFLSSVGRGITLAAPAFAQQLGKSFLEQEAGISCYTNVEQAIDLNKAKPLFKVLEDETADYLIGTVELSGYGEEWWPHVWIHKGGWIVAYYPKDEPTSRLMHWLGFKDTVTTTTLREVVISVARQLAVNMAKVESSLSYYHWQYPEASRMLIVIDTTNAGSDTMQYTIPTGLTLYELTGSHFGNVGSYWGSEWSATDIDGVRFLGGGNGSYILVARVPEKHLTPGVTHAVKISHAGGWVGLALFFLYQ